MRANYMLYKDFFLHVHTIYYLFYFLAVLGLLCCMQAFSSCGKQGLLSSRDAQTSNCGGFCYGAQALGAWASVVAAHGPQRVGSVVVVHGLSCSTTCEIFLDQGSNLCPLYWQSESLPLCHQGTPQQTPQNQLEIAYQYPNTCYELGHVLGKMDRLSSAERF